MIYASDLLERNDMKRILDTTGMGVESIEFSISDNLDYLDEKISQYRCRMEYYGINDLTLHGPFLDLSPVAFDSLVLKTTHYRFAQAYDAAVRLNAQKIIFHTCFIPSVYYLEGWAERMADFWNPFMASRQEIQVLLENVLDRYPEPIKKVKNLVAAPNFKLCLDIGHANCYSDIPPLEWALCFGDAIGHVHIHDNDGSRDAHLPPGAGNIPVNKILSTIRKSAPDATYTIECNTPKDVLSSYEFMRHHFGPV